jgi:hypothetical protein
VSLTGVPLLVLSSLAALGVLAGTVWFWRGTAWWRPVVRAAGILACEALVLFTAGLVVNRSLEIFPSWSALFNRHKAAPPPTVVADPGTRLDVWLHSRAVEGARNGLVFEWRPAGAAAWHLAAAPVIYVPPRYFTATALRFPVVLVVAPSHAGPAQGGWDPHKLNQVLPHADAEVNPAVLVFLRTDHPDETVLTHVVPAQLDEDLRAAARGWAVVGVDGDAGAAFAALHREPLRFWFAVALGARPTPPNLLDWQATTTEDRLPAAFPWVYRHLPAPLAPALTGPVDPAAPR